MQRTHLWSEEHVASAILEEFNPTAAETERMFQFLEFLVYFSNSAGLFLPAKSKHPDGRDPGHPHTTLQVGQFTARRQVQWKSGHATDESLAREDGKCRGAGPPSLFGTRSRTSDYCSMSEWQTIKFIKRTHNNKAVYRHRRTKRE